MAVLKNKRRFITIIAGGLSVLLLGVAYFLGLPSLSQNARATKVAHGDNDVIVLNVKKQDPVRLPKQVSVENELKIEVEPVHVSEEQVQFLVTLSSYQNSESVGMNPLETTMLLDEEDTPYSPVEWDLSHEDEYNKVGTLTFSVSHFPKGLRLSIFELEERVFEWSLAVPDVE